MNAMRIITEASLLLILIGFATAEVPQLITRDPHCQVFTCSLDNRLEGMDLCFKADIDQPSFVHLKKCSDGKMCNGQLNRCQRDPYNKFEGKLPGQICEYNFQCLSNNCRLSESGEQSHGTCVGALEQETCSDDRECSVGLYCQKLVGKCLKQKIESESCSSDSECSNQFTCANNQCVKYGSIRDYEQSDNNLACESGFIGQSAQEVDVCMPPPKIVNKEGPDYKCQSSQDTCIYEYTNENQQTQRFEQQCKCGFNPTASSFCPNIYTNSYTKLLAQVTDKLAGNCHTNDRTSIYECLYKNLRTSADVDLLNNFIIEHYEREQNNAIRENDSCMRKHSKVSQYWEAILNHTVNPDLHAPTKQTSKSLIMRPSFLVLMIVFALMIFFSNR